MTHALQQQLVDALEEARDYVRLTHNATAWHNDPKAYRMITKVIDPALKRARSSKKEMDHET